MAPLVRNAAEGDAESIAAIYSDAILTTTATFDTVPKTAADRLEWLRTHGDRYPVIVAEENGEVVGWASLSPWSDRCAYADTCEISVYIRKDRRGKGVGRALMEPLLEKGRANRLHTVIARIVEGNEVSVRLHRRFGFENVGVMKEVGFKFGRRLDVFMMQRIL